MMVYKKILVGNALAGFLFLALNACGGKEQSETPDDTDRLYQATINLSRKYSGLIANAPDSIGAIGLFDEFNALIDSLNFSVAPDTDLLLTEGENDTIFKELTQVRKTYESKLKSFNKKAQPSDTIANGNDQ